VFVVGCLGNWESAAKVLFESESLRWDIKKSGNKKQDTSKYAGRGIATISPTIGCELAKQVNNQMVKNAEAFYIPEPIVFENSRRDGVRIFDGVCSTLQSFMGTGGGNVPIALAENTIGRQPHNGGNGNGFTEGGPMYTLNATWVHGVSQHMAVRRLTPIECERLQGFPDDYTNIKEKCPDGPRYKAMGNSMAVPVMRWIGKRIMENI
jgi:site-specific DNA-cytosine methylase